MNEMYRERICMYCTDIHPVLATLYSSYSSALQADYGKQNQNHHQHLAYSFSLHTAKTQYRKFETNIPRKGTARPQSQFPHSCVYERFIYSHDRSAYSAAENVCTDPGNIQIAHRHMIVEIGTDAAQFPEKEYINGISVAVLILYQSLVHTFPGWIQKIKLNSLMFLKHPFLGRRPGKGMSPRSRVGRRPTGSDLLLADPSLL